ncbi:NAD(P)-dependent oxidoreductase [Selenomonas sp. AE3005]|uniref:NAD-dependent epimerase/dehydratase family protein n=1 Tax=Selenomonas sp. AE3005 TaxID=1485543 RepID=UPI0004856CC1|nr:NAD(P)-dependent oxidoreductase [Selenomonas sp. AE3005]
MRYVVVGGNGFVGYHLVKELLTTGENIVVLDTLRPKADIQDKIVYQEMDIRNQKAVDSFAFTPDDVVVQLAANQYHVKVPQGEKAMHDYFFGTNLVGTQNLLVSMEKQGCKNMIFFSTDMTYGKPQYLPVDTKHPQVPFGYYGASKKAAEKVCRQYREKGFNITIFRPRMILGPGRLGILAKLFRLMDYNLPVPLIGKGKNCYQMVSVFDCVQAIIKCVEHGIPNREYNLGSDNPPTVYELLHDVIYDVGSHSSLIRTNGKMVKTILAGMGHLGISLMYREQYEIADENYILDIQATKDELGWHPQYNDKDMLYSAYEAYKGAGN